MAVITMYVLLVYVIFARIVSTEELNLSAGGVCSFKLGSGQVSHRCCYNHFKTDEGCIECANGSLSLDGEECKPCSSNTFGYQCQGRCKCATNEYCDSISGCLSTTTYVLPELQSLDYTTVRIKNGTTNEQNENYTTVRIKNGTTNEQNDRSITILYTISAVGSLIFVISVFACIGYIRIRRKRRLLLPLNVEQDHGNQNVNIEEADYDEIEEIDVDNDNLNPRNSYMSVKDSLSGFAVGSVEVAEQAITSDYLDPCNLSQHDESDKNSDIGSVYVSNETINSENSYEEVGGAGNVNRCRIHSSPRGLTCTADKYEKLSVVKDDHEYNQKVDVDIERGINQEAS